MSRYEDASTERQRIRRIIRAERAHHLALKATNTSEARACAQAVYVCDTLLNAIKPRKATR